MYLQDQRGAMTYAVNKGIEQGKAEGKAEGIEQGSQAMQRSIAQQLLSTLDDGMISRAMGLSLEEVRSLRTLRHE